MKTYRDNPPIGAARHSVSFHDGIKTHKDGSPFFDIKTFARRKEKDAFIRRIKRDGYAADSIK